MATACSKGLACVFVGFAWLHLKNQIIQPCHKNHDSPDAGGDQQASTKWAAGGLQLAETNGTEMERKVLRYEALE